MELSPLNVYKEMCPVNPRVLSSLDPKQFGAYMTSKDTHHSVPTLAYTDVRMIDLDNMDNTGHIGRVYNHNIESLKESIESLKSTNKKTKTIDRSTGVAFSHQMIHRGILLPGVMSLLCLPCPL